MERQVKIYSTHKISFHFNESNLCKFKLILYCLSFFLLFLRSIQSKFIPRSKANNAQQTDCLQRAPDEQCNPDASEVESSAEDQDQRQGKSDHPETNHSKRNGGVLEADSSRNTKFLKLNLITSQKTKLEAASWRMIEKKIEAKLIG